MSQVNNNLNIPPVIFGTSGLGNLYVSLEEEIKLSIIRECVRASHGPVVFDSAGKYGAGLALESLGRNLRTLAVQPENVIISNKLGWVRTELKTPEPTFEPGVWKNLNHDAIQKISYDGIMESFDQGNQLLGTYIPQYVSVHDPDEYLAGARNPDEESELYSDILMAYQALEDLKKAGKVQAIGVGAKNWRIIKRISKDIKLDWVMIANSFTIMNHSQDLLNFIEELNHQGVQIINSAVFHGGFLIGGDYLDYKLIKPDSEKNIQVFKWREQFFELCHRYRIKPAEACVKFALSPPGIVSIALSTTNPNRVKENVEMEGANIPQGFWRAMKEKGLINRNYKYL